jgi:hypothetical protein
MQRTKTDGTAWLRSSYDRALAEVAREHARAKAAPAAARRAVAATQERAAGRPSAADTPADVAA